MLRLVRQQRCARRLAFRAMSDSPQRFVPAHDLPHSREIVVEKQLEGNEDEEDDEDMVVIGPTGAEWGGPRRGGKFQEPTRYGDWEKKGRCTDF